jgi:hypothetical protein
VQVLPQFTGFTGTKVQILTLAALRGRELCYRVRVEKCKYCLSMGETIMHAAARYKTDWIQSMCYYSMCSKAGQQPVKHVSS